jgi:hypothetical protein
MQKRKKILVVKTTIMQERLDKLSEQDFGRLDEGSRFFAQGRRVTASESAKQAVSPLSTKSASKMELPFFRRIFFLD